MVYDGMLSTKGISGAVANIQRRRQKRYYRILSAAGAAVENRRLQEPDYESPLPPTVEQYMTGHPCLDAETLRDVWLTQTHIYSRLCEAQMADTKCTRVIRLDHSQKFCSNLNVHEADGSKDQSASIRMRLLVQNEIGQIMGRSLTRSENHLETSALLLGMCEKMSSQTDGPRICVCDNAKANRNLIEKIFGAAVVVKQDPFHVIARFTEKIKEKPKRKWLAGALSTAMDAVEQNLRPPGEMEAKIKALVSKIHPSDLNVKTAEWEGCVASNLEQVRLGDLYVAENQYMEKGGSVRVVSTSQLEAIHSKLQKLLDRVVSVEMGLRILDIFILQVQQHNLMMGAKHSRNPVFTGTDFMAVCQSAVTCRGQIPDTPQFEYMRALLSRHHCGGYPCEMYRPGAAESAGNCPWKQLYDMVELDAHRAEATLLHRLERIDDIRALLTSVHIKQKPITRADFVGMLGLEPEYEGTTDFAAHEYALLKQLRAEQLASRRSWAQCGVVATVLYNTAVHQLSNPCLGVKKRGFRAVAKRLTMIDEQLEHAAIQPVSERILALTQKSVNDEQIPPDEEALMKQLFMMIRGAQAFK
ncbi:hypothetical protein BBJ28_00021981 [Nothophytophthora sp. Chile5]|nr:hypothetical protein BBJ28_00021981 [Nothophytophthora sp. Chile5]